MACSLEKINKNTLQKFVKYFNNLPQTERVTLKKFDSKGRMVFNSLTSKKYSTEAAALKTRESVKNKIEPIIEKWASDTFGKDFSKGFLTDIKGTHPVLKFAMPEYLKNAYNEKIGYEARREEEAKLKEQGEQIMNEYNESVANSQEFDDLPANLNTVNPVNKTIVQPNFDDYLKHKQKLLKNVEKTITRLYNDKRLHDTVEVNKKLTRFNFIKEALENDIKDFNSPIDRIELVKDYFDKDTKTINELLSNPTLDNIFLAKYIFEYLERTKRSEAKEGDIFALKGDQKFSPEVKELIKQIESTLEDTKNNIDDAVDRVFLQLLEKNAEGLSKLHPGKSLNEIKDELLKNLQDINKLESMFFTQGTNLTSKKNIIDELIVLEYERSKHLQNARIQPIIQTINQLIPGIETELAKQGKSFKFRNKQVYDYNWLYRQSRTAEPQLVSKFSKHWDTTIKLLHKKYSDDLREARSNRDWAEVERLLRNKFNDLNDKTEFINIGLLHDLQEVEFQRGTSQEAEVYKKELISKIGQEEYDRVLENQRILLDKFKNEAELIIQVKLQSEGVAEISALSNNAKNSIENSIKRIDPMAFLDSFYSGYKGMVVIKYGTQMDEKPSCLNFNSYIPKAKNNVGLDTEFYDKNFTEIENNPVMYEFWQKIREGVLLINENLVDSDLKLKYNSILNFKEGITKETLNKSFIQQLKGGVSWMENIKSFLKNIISAKVTKYNDSEYVQLAHQLKTVEGEVNQEFELMKTDISNIIGSTLLPNTIIAYNQLSKADQQAIADAVGADNIKEFEDQATNKGLFRPDDLKYFAQKRVMEQQSLNLPAMIKGLLELSADHQARAASKNETNIYRMKSAAILIAENGWHQKQGAVRENEIKRQDFFYEKVILNKNQKDHSWNISKGIISQLHKDKFNGPLVGEHFYKNYNANEKAIYTAAIQRMKQIDTEIDNTTSTAKLALLSIEKEALAQRVDLLGKDYMLSALFDNTVNTLRVKMGLAFNILAALNNFKQGFITTLNRDGEFWQRGNIYPVQHFVGLRNLRHINSSVKKEWDIADLFIEQLGIVETGTNELQKAEAEIKNKAGWMQPMFLTEKVEYRNQAKGILAMAMDMEIEHATEKNPDGTPAKYPLFNGAKFIPYINDNGVLKLKPEFDTPKNRSHLLSMDSKEISDWKLNVRTMNNSMNGDYTKTGVTRIKNSLFTRPLMTYKTWIPEYISARWKYKQANVLTGQEETGFMLASLINKKTSVAASLMLATTGVLGVATASPVLAVGFVASLGLGYGYAKYKGAKTNTSAQLMVDITEPIAIVQQAMYFLKMINPLALAEMPINTIFGKELIKPVEFKSEFNLTDQEKKGLRSMGRNMQQLAILMLVKISIQLFLKDNEDDEPKGEIGTPQRDKYLAQQESRANGHHFYNFLENQISGTFNESSFGTDPAAIWKAGSEGGIEGQLKNIIKLGNSLFHPFDEIQKGPRQGQNKLGNAMRAMFLPALFRDLGHSTYALGFENAMLTEWDKTESFDGIFDSDYKTDKKTITKERNEKKQDLINQYEEINNVDYDEMTEYEQDNVDKIVKRQMGDEFDNPDRKGYDEDQSINEE